ncbi:hypothetical protein LOTGIDRAFT_233119 [Lottia gigantea]|uniref:EGF-like domain-containing protein n=1 Tax=Lottia gigantea TaxID=225164 RepID=V4A6M5_LOTGI|nr:hypothetical protein LOTGIDRAFT_233119 [Lottia gigantea]ESO92347.1 hypothetical protein LOTGIDRAFT_233119 [Lottia gigantea]
MTKMYVYQPTFQCLVIMLFVVFPQFSAFPRKFGNLSNVLMDFCQNSCRNGHCTTDGKSSYIVKCKCNEGFAGKYCNRSDCNPTCKHGSCVFDGSQQVCKCEKGFSGVDCNNVNLNSILGIDSIARGRNSVNSSISLPSSLCALNFVCQNGGSCIRFQRGVRCQCVYPYTGTFCQDKCEKVCQNNGRCLLLDEADVCNCPWGYNGEFCELKLS